MKTVYIAIIAIVIICSPTDNSTEPRPRVELSIKSVMPGGRILRTVDRVLVGVPLADVADCFLLSGEEWIGTYVSVRYSVRNKSGTAIRVDTPSVRRAIGSAVFLDSENKRWSIKLTAEPIDDFPIYDLFLSPASERDVVEQILFVVLVNDDGAQWSSVPCTGAMIQYRVDSSVAVHQIKWAPHRVHWQIQAEGEAELRIRD